MNTPADRPVVLLIEDHTDSREMYAVMLGAAGFDVLEMATAEDALAQPSRECRLSW